MVNVATLAIVDCVWYIDHMTTHPTTHTAAYWREHYDLDHMTVGTRQSVINGMVTRVRPHEYCLHWNQPSARARWGTAAEIAEDIAYLATYGVLPPANGGPW